LEQLEGFLEKLEERLSYHLYGENEEEEEEVEELFSMQEITIHDLRRNNTKQRRPKKGKIIIKVTSVQSIYSLLINLFHFHPISL
jgi:hypothetical protein